MTVATPASTRLDEVQRLTSALADQVLDAQVMGRPVPRHQAVALAQAATFMDDVGMEWPPMLKQALHGLAEGVGTDAASPQEVQTAQDDGGVIEGVTRFMSAFRKQRG